MSVDDDQQVVRGPMDRTLREEGESPSSPPELAAGDFYGNPPVVHGPVYRVDVAIGQDNDENDNDNDLYSDDEEGDVPFEDQEMAYVPSYIQGLLLDESSNLVVRYFEHSVSEVQGLVEDDDDDTYEGGEEEEDIHEDRTEEVEGGEEDIHDEKEEEEGDEQEEHGGGYDDYSDVEGFRDECEETELSKYEDVEDRRTLDELSESSPGDENHSINSQQNEDWYSGGLLR